MTAAGSRVATSRNTPPCGEPRPCRTSLLIARATSSRGRSSGGLRLLAWSVYQRSASSSVSAVSESAGHAVAVLQEPQRGALHEHLDRPLHGLVLQRAYHLEARPVADVRQARVPVAAEVALQDEAVGGAVERGPPLLQLQHAIR